MPSESVAALRVESPDFMAGQRIPERCASRPEGRNEAPALRWSGAPVRTAEFALIVDDPDAPRTTPWVHWLAWGIPASATSLPHGNAVVEGRNDFGQTGWGGPLPPEGDGDHRYRFRVYALDAPITLASGTTKPHLLDAMKGHVLAEGELVGTYSR